MHKMFKIFFLIFCLSIVPNIVFGSQIIYFAPNPGFLKRVSTLKSVGKNRNEILGILISQHELQKVDETMARDIFKMERWLPGDFTAPGGEALPNLIIVNMGPEVGYGLMTMDPIRANAIVIEYTGRILVSACPISDSYIMKAGQNARGEALSVSAAYEGNAARFAQHFPESQRLGLDDGRYPKLAYCNIVNYIFKSLGEIQNVATANLNSIRDMGSNQIFLVATRNIESLELLGYDYGPTYQWQVAPRLFDRAGNLIPENQYNVINRKLVVQNSADVDKMQSVISTGRVAIGNSMSLVDFPGLCLGADKVVDVIDIPTQIDGICLRINIHELARVLSQHNPYPRILGVVRPLIQNKRK